MREKTGVLNVESERPRLPSDSISLTSPARSVKRIVSRTPSTQIPRGIVNEVPKFRVGLNNRSNHLTRPIQDGPNRLQDQTTCPMMGFAPDSLASRATKGWSGVCWFGRRMTCRPLISSQRTSDLPSTLAATIRP